MKKTKRESLVLANWGRRFIAWFVDYLILHVMIAYFGLEQIETRLIPQWLMPNLPGFPQWLLPNLPEFDISIWSPLSVLVFFIYWTFSEWYFGRSIGGLLLNLRLVGARGGGVSLKGSALQSFGKSLLLPLDCLIGWAYLSSRERRQRFFNRVSNTIVIYIGKPNRVIKQGEYGKEP